MDGEVSYQLCTKRLKRQSRNTGTRRSALVALAVKSIWPGAQESNPRPELAAQEGFQWARLQFSNRGSFYQGPQYYHVYKYIHTFKLKIHWETNFLLSCTLYMIPPTCFLWWCHNLAALRPLPLLMVYLQRVMDPTTDYTILGYSQQAFNMPLVICKHVQKSQCLVTY